MQAIIKKLNSYRQLSEQSIELLQSHLIYKHIPKSTILLEEGETAKRIYWVEKGTFRGRICPKDELVTTWFVVGGGFSTSMISFMTQTPSEESIEALEDCEVYYFTHRSLQSLYLAAPEISTISRMMMEEYIISLKQRTYRFQYLSAKERYDEFLATYPHLMQKVPLGMIASFIGVTQSSLSRIRKMG